MRCFRILAGLSLCLLTACVDGIVDHQFIALDEQCWNRNDTLRFDLKPVKESGVYGGQVQLRTLQDFRYKNIWIVVEQEWGAKCLRTADTLCVDLEILPHESSESGIILQHFVSEIIPVKLKRGQKGKVRIRHLMQEENIRSVTEVGYFLAKPEKIASKDSNRLKDFL